MSYLTFALSLAGIAAEMYGLPWLTCACAVTGVMAWSAHLENEIEQAIDADSEIEEAFLENQP